MVTHMFASSPQLKMSGRTDQIFSNSNKKGIKQKKIYKEAGGGQQDRKQQESLSCQRKTIPLG